MFSISKKSFLLPLILCTVLHTQCSEFNDHGVPRRTITLSIDDIPQKENSQLYELGRILLPVAGSALINYMLQKYNADPEDATLNKELKRIELQTQSHPDYPTIALQDKHNKTETTKLHNREKEIELSIATANIVQHHQEQWAKFRKCEAPFTADFCTHMVNLHEQELYKITQKNITQS